jgi:hypothetical protein
MPHREKIARAKARAAREAAHGLALKRQAMLLAAQLPEDPVDALTVLALMEALVREFLTSEEAAPVAPPDLKLVV